MICASCAKDIPAGARYCVHCGAEQSPPTPIAAVAAAAMARASNVKAANAAHAEPRVRLRVDAANQPSGSTGDQSSRFGRARDAGAKPAYAARPGRRDLAIALVAGWAVVAVAAGVAWRIHDSGAPTAAQSEDGQRAGSAGGRAHATASATPATGPPGAVAGAASVAEPVADRNLPAPIGAVATAPPPEVQSGASAMPSSGPPIEIKPLPPRPAPSRPPRHAAEKAPAAPEAAVSAAPVLAAAPPAAAARSDRVLASASARAPVIASVANHWRQMDDELSHCTREDFISRVVCAQRVRFRYCNGYWGRAAQCPASPAPERGQ